MIPERLRTSERELRKAIARRQYDGLQRRLENLRRIADECIAELPENNPLRLEIARWMLATIEWARLMVTTQRQVWSGESKRLASIGTYAHSKRAPGLCLDL